MMTQVAGKIFLAGQRGLEETSEYRSWYTLNYGNYYDASKQPFGQLYTVNDDILAGNYSTTTVVAEDSCVLLLPVVGAITFSINGGEEHMIQAGELLCAAVNAGSRITIGNPYDANLVNFIQFRLKTGSHCKEEVVISAFSFTKNQDKLIPINFEMDGQTIRCHIGKFMGRQEAVCQVNTECGLFTYIIEGAFEVQNRLLEAREALALHNVGEIELEALSNGAILFLLEVAMP
jgi:hypothetical protein